MTSRERIIKCLNGEKTDRVPISTYEMVGHVYKDFYNTTPSYQRLMGVIRKDTDCFCMWAPVLTRGNMHFLTGADVETSVTTWDDGDMTFCKTVYETPKGPLTSLTRTDRGLYTTWELEHLLKDISDVDKLLSIPYEPLDPDVSSYFQIKEALGENGVMFPNINDPLLCVAELFGFTDFVMLMFEEEEKISKLINLFSERVLQYLDALLKKGVGDVFRIIGPEYATPPYLPKKMFMDYVYPHDRKMIELIKRSGAFARVHCHGRVGDLLEEFRDMGADALDPIEAPPSGDITLKEAKKRIGGDVTLFGNMQLHDLEQLAAAQIREMTKQILADGMENGRFVLTPTASPISDPLSLKTEENYLIMIETAREFGTY